MHSQILQPVVVLIAWSLVMLVWMIVVRLPAMKKAGIDLGKARGGRPGALDGTIPDQAQWPAHNYIHLMEQPTLFYAVALVLAMSGVATGTDAALAWAYVALRVAHSLWQIARNVVFPRFLLFWTSTLVLAVLTVRAGVAVF